MKSATYSLWGEVAWLLNRITDPHRERVFQWELSEGTFYHHYGKILVDAQLPDDRKHKLHSLRVSHNTWTKAMTGCHSPLLMHSSTATSERHYEDRRFTVKPPPKPFVPWHSPAPEPQPLSLVDEKVGRREAMRLPRAKLLTAGKVGAQ
jgi:hypothetical protein